MRALHRHRIEELRNIGGVIVDAISAVGTVGLPEPALVRHERVTVRREERQHPAERKPGVRPPVQKDDRLAMIVTLLCVVKPGAVGQLSCCESHVCHDCADLGTNPRYFDARRA